jgi:hypothetical protein
MNYYYLLNGPIKTDKKNIVDIILNIFYCKYESGSGSDKPNNS